MKTGRLEAFSDGVLAIIITIMVLEMKVPEGTSFEALKPVLAVFLTYLGSFVYLGIYWNNHHHLMQATNKVKGNISVILYTFAVILSFFQPIISIIIYILVAIIWFVPDSRIEKNINL